jgi:DNA replication protein DnaC
VRQAEERERFRSAKATACPSLEYLFELIMRRYENKATMMTSNRPVEEWGKLLQDVPSATAILDRFLHHAEIVPMKGKSYRLKGKKVAEETESE